MLDLIKIRRELHQYPEISGQESVTATRILGYLGQCAPSSIISGMGGYGVAAIYDSGHQGETILLRCELDALPITETGQIEHRSTIDGKAHLCGHDGHMAIILGVAQRLYAKPITRGRAVLLFQPAEETGAGAPAIIADDRFNGIKPDYAYALHNLPGMPLGHIGLKSGPICFASEGLVIRFQGRTSHASHPEDAVSPMAALAKIFSDLPDLPHRLGVSPQQALITICHANLGTYALGITPGDATLLVTVRAENNTLQTQIMQKASEYVKACAHEHGLAVSIDYAEKFSACNNDESAADHIRLAAKEHDFPLTLLNKPYRWSEDFGCFSTIGKAALFVLGSGEDCPQLHAPDYDFPDSIITTGVDMFEAIARSHCG